MIATVASRVPPANLRAGTAADVMTPSPLSLSADATVPEAIALFASKGFSAAPVIDDAGRPVGVLSHSDILVHLHSVPRDAPASAPGGVFRVSDLMTPGVFSVNPDTPMADLVEEIVGLNVHHLFVVDKAGVLVGVVSALDILSGLTRNDRAAAFEG